MKLDPVTQAHLAGAQSGDRDGMDAMMEGHQWLVVGIAKRFAAPREARFDDYKQAGMIGLWRAVLKFNASKGWQFSTYATRCITVAMLDERTNVGPIYIPKTISPHNHRLRDAAKGAAQLTNVVCDRHLVCNQTPDSQYEEAEAAEQLHVLSENLKLALGRLTTRERCVVNKKISGMKYVDIAKDLGVSKQRVSQLYVAATQRLKAILL